MNLAKCCQFGLEFHEYLKKTGQETIKRNQLKDIYNKEFRYEYEGINGPNFSKILYSLSVSNKAAVYRGKVRFYSEEKHQHRDQWANSYRRKKPVLVQDGPSSPSSVPGTKAFWPGPEVPGSNARRKLASLLMVKLKEDSTHFISDKNGVVISSDHEVADRKICLCVEDEREHVVRLFVKNAGTTAVYFTYYTLLNWLKCFQMHDEQKVTRARPLTLEPGDKYEIQLMFHASLVSFYPATMAFEFKPDLLPSSVAFHIVRYVQVQRITSLGKELAPVAPYKVFSISALPASDECLVIDGQRPEGQSVMHLKVVIHLKIYKVPQFMNRLIDLLKCPGLKMDQGTRDRKALLEGPLTMENYCDRFQLLLYLEEQQMLVDIKRYNIPNSDGEYAPMYRDKADKRLLVLKVPGVAENRPSVLRGDKILVCPEGKRGVKYRGYVHAVEQESVKLGFSSKLLDGFVDGMRFSVEFNMCPTPLRLQHLAAELAVDHGLGEVLLFDRQLEKNQEQYKAVQHIVAGTSKPAPYLVFGPPGTGKTVTVVEAIKQIHKTQASCHILACAPSNSAADLVFRLYANSLDFKRIPTELKDCCNLIGEVYEYPSREDLMKYSIIVTTLCTAGRLVTGGLPLGHFSHVFVDEAGHAVETECIIPIAGLLQPESGQVVLAGDPKQLGPILRSPLVQRFGMGRSLLERLMETIPVYQGIIVDEGEEDKVVDDEDGDEEESMRLFYDPRFVTKLLCNYRSHPAILKMPNSLFYGQELKVCADPMLRNSYCAWEYLPKMDFPVIFHGVTGLDEQEASSPSFFNRAEVEHLMNYVRKLLEKDGRKGRSRISAKDIGIITPYRKQVLKIRKALKILERELKMSNLYMDLKVGSVEEFQGQERTVILVSTVRSSAQYTDHDKQFTLGFVKNEKRFNVAVTRAKALLIMVGNPRVLSVDPVWNSFIEYCKDNGGYTGYSYTEEADAVEKLATLYRASSLQWRQKRVSFSSSWTQHGGTSCDESPGTTHPFGGFCLDV
ncbi:hypothetical protein NHX12_012766 [Muraenolepis orangiensis]|uniref:RNA helicase n=1 Tax=Muraenolepis orangiensis TaxID=630683 RepID=A0A9Q0DGS6_9TELE|nr:hypothetical protein NHX12_012766 [Muraenolepis orangiensis]